VAAVPARAKPPPCSLSISSTWTAR
jgi:hypothetical protein